jgi:peptide/nickel transport system permease protein
VLGYLAKRVVMTLVVVLLVMTALALLVRIVPGDPVQTILGQRATPYLKHLVREQMDLDKPLHAQVYDFIRHAGRGDLGIDFTSQQSVTGLIGAALPHTIILAISSLLLAVVVGIPLGVFAATRPNSIADRISGILSISVITLPSYVLALFLLLIFVVHFGWFPSFGTGSLAHPLDYAMHLVLPSIAIGLGWIGYLSRLVRASMFEVLNANYMRSLRAFGLPQRRLFYRYALKNAVIPTVAVLGVGLGSLMGGTVFAEVIFSRPGIGSLLFDSVEQRNWPIVRGCVLVIAVLFVAANLLADLSYRVLDPRIRLQQR